MIIKMENQTPYCLVYDLAQNVFAHCISYNCDAELFKLGYIVTQRFTTLENAEIAHAQKNLIVKSLANAALETNKKVKRKKPFTPIKRGLLLLPILSLDEIKN